MYCLETEFIFVMIGLQKFNEIFYKLCRKLCHICTCHSDTIRSEFESINSLVNYVSSLKPQQISLENYSIHKKTELYKHILFIKKNKLQKKIKVWIKYPKVMQMVTIIISSRTKQKSLGKQFFLHFQGHLYHKSVVNLNTYIEYCLHISIPYII